MPPRPYHHGALRDALIEATEALLAAGGPTSFSLREVARRAGVSPAAPAHHFGDTAGLLTAVATQAFDSLTAALHEGEERAGTDPRKRLVGQGLAYVAYAMRYPGRFRLMFGEELDAGSPELARAGNTAFLVLEDGIRAAFGIARGAPLNAGASSALLALWSAVHGFAHLTIAGRFDEISRGSRAAFVKQSLGPVLDAVVDGTIPAPNPRRPRRASK